MLHFLAITIFCAIIMISILVMAITIKAELRRGLSVLGIAPDFSPLLRQNRAPRVRFTPPRERVARQRLRAAA